jgi:starvation-inducible DNA-binding protein
MATAKSRTKKAPTTLPANIGIDEKNRKAIGELLNHRLADTTVLYQKTRNYHWNVTGMHFAELHEFFEEQYDQMAASIDEIAERVRQMGVFAIGTLDEMKSYSAVEERPGVIPEAVDMVRDLLNDHEMVIRQLREDIDTVEKMDDMGTADFLTALMEAHEKMAWMLRAHLEGGQ